MGKTRRGYKEYSREQRLIHENKKLKRENASLRKQLARLDLDRHAYVKDLIDRSYVMEEELEGHKVLERLQKEWVCRECARGHLEIICYNKPNETWYYRKCTNCSHRTKSQKYTPGVPGIIKDTEKS